MRTGVKIGKLGVSDTAASPVKLEKPTGDIISTKQFYSRILGKQKRWTEILQESCKKKKIQVLRERA
jgi:hypothetical protein